MHKATIAEGVILLASGATAAGLGFANQIGQALRTSYFACPTKGCTVSIRARGTDAAELGRLRVLATDHSKHGSTR